MRTFLTVLKGCTRAGCHKKRHPKKRGRSLINRGRSRGGRVQLFTGDEGERVICSSCQPAHICDTQPQAPTAAQSKQ
jgi:hypothetical protein